MALAEVQSTIQECKTLALRGRAFQEAHEKQKGLLAELANLDQELAEFRAREVESVTRMADTTVTSGRKLVERLVLLAQVRQHFNEAIQDSNQAAELELADQRDLVLRTQARDFVSQSGEAIEVCLDALANSIAAEDISSATVLCQQAQRLTAAMREIQDAWPWFDEQGVQESWRQYECGELMDFEMFKHELLKASK